MDLNDITERLEEARPDDKDGVGMEVLAAKVGQMAQAKLRIEYAEKEGALNEERAQALRADIFGGMFVALLEYAAKHDLDIVAAVEERVEFVEQRAEARDALQSNDPRRVAEQIKEQQGNYSGAEWDERGVH